LLIAVSLVLTFLHLKAQDTAFLSDIQKFKKQDSVSFPAKGAILFVGSSSFTKWKDVQSYFPGYKIINRGFGGSTLPDVIRYANDIIIPYHPKQIVIYCGDNDLASSDTIKPETVYKRFRKLFSILRTNLPKTKLTYISIKPSPSRVHLKSKMERTNALISSFIKTQKNCSFIDIYHKMLLPDGKPAPTIFVDDSLHMNDKGYAVWKKAIQPHLIKR
jgi:lysophospholipase L1-like esterase